MQPQKCKFEEKVPTAKKHTINDYLFHNVLLLETNWAKEVVKPILETRKASDVDLHVWFIHSLTKIFKKVKCKKELFQMYKIYTKKLK